MQRPPARKAIFWHYPHYGNQGGQPGSAVRWGDWKLIRFFEDNHSELYNLKEDLSEKHDLCTQKPEKAQELNALLDRFLQESHATMPKPNPDFSPPTRKPPRQERTSHSPGAIGVGRKRRRSADHENLPRSVGAVLHDADLERRSESKDLLRRIATKTQQPLARSPASRDAREG